MASYETAAAAIRPLALRRLRRSTGATIQCSNSSVLQVHGGSNSTGLQIERRLHTEPGLLSLLIMTGPVRSAQATGPADTDMLPNRHAQASRRASSAAQ